jgi:hypothetical protein
MRFVKTIAFLVVISASFDALFWNGAYRRHLGRSVIETAASVSSANWLGLNRV